jgi:ABC-type glycerol-3-phosphate transport system substrate-binding protein
MSQRIRAIALALATTLAVVGCGPSAETGAPTEAPAAPADGATVLNLIMEEVPDTDIVLALIEDFEAQHDDISIEVEVLPFDQMRDRIITSALAPTPTYDIIVVDNPWMVDFVNGGYLLELDEYVAATDGYDYEDFTEPLRAIGQVDGGIYGVPFYNYALSLVYRTDVLEDLGASVPSTVADYQALVAEIGSSTDLRGLAMQPQRGYKIFEEWANWLYAFGGRLTDESGTVVLDSDEARAALQAYIDTYAASAPADSLNWGFDEALRAVSGGEAATMISYNWMLPTLNAPDGPSGDLAGSFAVAEVPGGVATLGSWSWAIMLNTDAADAAWTFISWISSPEIERQRVIAGGAPVRVSSMRDPEVWAQGFGQAYYETVERILEDAITLATGPNAEEVIELVGEQLNAAVAGQISVDEAISAAAAAAAAAFARAG